MNIVVSDQLLFILKFFKDKMSKVKSSRFKWKT